VQREPAAARPRLIALAELQIRARHASEALELWNAVSTPLDSGVSALANGELATSPSNAAFDWRLPGTQGCQASWQRGQISFSLSGDQPESCGLLEQTVALDSGRHYRLRFEYLTHDLTSPAGIAWELDGASGPSLQPADVWHAAEVAVAPRSSGPAHLQLSRLRLLYRREPGAVRAQGQIRLRHLRMKAQ
jgi:hypothetical protein